MDLLQEIKWRLREVISLSHRVSESEHKLGNPSHRVCDYNKNTGCSLDSCSPPAPVCYCNLRAFEENRAQTFPSS